jgi:hypothetical protein
VGRTILSRPQIVCFSRTNIRSTVRLGPVAILTAPHTSLYGRILGSLPPHVPSNTIIGPGVDPRWLLLLSALLWTPLSIIGAQGLFGFDLYQGFGPLWIALNLAVGLVAIPVAIWIARSLAERPRGSRFLRRLADELGGRNLVVARGFVHEITRFQADR